MTEIATEGYIGLDGATINGTEGDAGSSLNWTNTVVHGVGGADSDNNYNIGDPGEDGYLHVGVDYFVSAPFYFTGYTITSSGVEYGVFSDGTTYLVPLPQDGTTQNIIPSSGTTNVYQSQALAYLCFAAGTMISTPMGERAVEGLQIGDEVLTAEGLAVEVKWIGRQSVKTRFGAADRLRLVRFAAGSLGNGLPHSDLTVTADHGMLVDGVICHAGALVNGETITRVPLAEMGESYTVYHIETEAHEIVLANGAPAETFIDNVSRRVFDNYAEFEALYGDVPEMDELPYPHAMSARQVPGRILAHLGSVHAA
ncbi:Hint domain-containing protein [Nioella aestuarii]|uniref:Hint domain-containing protein n=1 Tax=Nioella aestuarii TaxID=1662864 RepID=UPI003D7F7487